EILAGAEGELAKLVECYLSVTLTDRVRPLDAMRKLRQYFPYAVHMEWQPSGGGGAVLNYAEKIRGRSDAEVTHGFLDDCRGMGPSEWEIGLLRAALETAGRPDGSIEPAGSESG